MCVCEGGYKVMEGFTCFAVRRVVMVGFWGGEGTGGDPGGDSESVGSVRSHCGPEP